MIYALSNAGGDPNVTNEKGNTPLHELLQRDLIEVNFDLVQVKRRRSIGRSKEMEIHLGVNTRRC